MRVGECEAGETSVCEGFQCKCWAAGRGGGSFVHREQREEEGEVRVGECESGEGGVEEKSEGYATE